MVFIFYNHLIQNNKTCREQKISDAVWKRSIGFKNLHRHIEERKIVIEGMQKSWILYLSITHIAEIMRFLVVNCKILNTGIFIRGRACILLNGFF